MCRVCVRKENAENEKCIFLNIIIGKCRIKEEIIDRERDKVKMKKKKTERTNNKD